MHLGNIIFHFISDTDLQIDQELLPFLLPEPLSPDVDIAVSWDWDPKLFPKTKMEGRDVLQEYYEENGRRYALSIGNGTEYLAGSVWKKSDFRHIDCYVNKNLCYPLETALGTVMRFLPVRAVFMQYGVLFFHASQIAFQDKGILFTAPSGTGKTTQAKLWQNYRNARMICNDRTLIRRQDETWFTYGYPLDGSEPVRSGEVYPLGCIVVLRQGDRNRAERLRGARAISMLLPQLVLDEWDADIRVRAIELLMSLLEHIPVYLYICTKERDAVDDLEKKLISDGVLDYGDNQRPPLEESGGKENSIDSGF